MFSLSSCAPGWTVTGELQGFKGLVLQGNSATGPQKQKKRYRFKKQPQNKQISNGACVNLVLRWMVSDIVGLTFQKHIKGNDTMGHRKKMTKYMWWRVYTYNWNGWIHGATIVWQFFACFRPAAILKCSVHAVALDLFENMGHTRCQESHL